MKVIWTTRLIWLWIWINQNLIDSRAKWRPTEVKTKTCQTFTTPFLVFLRYLIFLHMIERENWHSTISVAFLRRESGAQWCHSSRSSPEKRLQSFQVLLCTEVYVLVTFGLDACKWRIIKSMQIRQYCQPSSLVFDHMSGKNLKLTSEQACVFCLSSCYFVFSLKKPQKTIQYNTIRLVYGGGIEPNVKQEFHVGYFRASSSKTNNKKTEKTTFMENSCFWGRKQRVNNILWKSRRKTVIPFSSLWLTVELIVWSAIYTCPGTLWNVFNTLHRALNSTIWQS